MGKPNNARCPRCKARLRKSGGISMSYTCGRCGYNKTEEPDNLTKAFIYGPLFKTKRRRPNGTE